MKHPGRNKYLFTALLLLVTAAAGYGFTRVSAALERQKGAEELLIVTSFYPMYVATVNVVGDCEGIRVENLSEPQGGCLHDYQMTPQDMILLSQADIFVVNGGGMEAFLSDVAQEYPDLVILDAGAGIFSDESGLDHEANEEHAHEGHSHGENAHAWMSFSHYREQVAAIRDGLMRENPARLENFAGNAIIYLNKIEELEKESDNLKEVLQGQEVVILHEAFEYLAEDYGLEVAGEWNLDEERQVSTGELAAAINLIKERDIRLILAEPLYGGRMGDAIEKETDGRVCYLDSLVQGEETGDGWLDGMAENLRLLEQAALGE